MGINESRHHSWDARPSSNHSPRREGGGREPSPPPRIARVANGGVKEWGRVLQKARARAADAAAKG